jgi:hypothetical protein
MQRCDIATRHGFKMEIIDLISIIVKCLIKKKTTKLKLKTNTKNHVQNLHINSPTTRYVL